MRLTGIRKNSGKRRCIVKSLTKFLVPVIAGLFALGARPVMAQSTIFNVPTTDTVAKGDVDLNIDYRAQRPNAHIERLHILGPRFVVGLGSNIEIGAAVPTEHIPGQTQAFFQPNIKWKFASRDEKGLAAALGGILVTPLNYRQGTTTYGLVYANFSKRVTSSSYGPRFTTGPYGVITGKGYWPGSKAGAMVGYEQPIHSRASIVADWASGKNDVGYFTPGMSFKVPVIGRVKGGYSFGNDGDRDNRFVFVSYGVTL